MGIWKKVVSKVWGPKTSSDADFEYRVRKDGVESAAKDIAKLVIKKISSKEVALQFILEELDAAWLGNDKSKSFAQNSGFSEYEYIGAMEKTVWDGDESELEHAQLYLRSFISKISDIDLMVSLATAVVDEMMKNWELGKYSNQSSNNNLTNSKKYEIAEHYSKMTSWPLAQIDLEPPTGEGAVELVEFVLDYLSDDLMQKTDAYILAMAAAINTAKNAIANNELSAACMLSASVMIAVGGKDGLSEEEIQATKDLSDKAKEIILKYKDSLEYRLNLNLVINMALNGLNNEKPVPVETISGGEDTLTYDEIIDKLQSLSDTDLDLDVRMKIMSIKDDYLSYEFYYNSKDSERADILAHNLYCMDNNLVIQCYNNV